MNKNVVIKSLILITLAIVFGAFGAHYLENILESKQLNSFKTGVDYQMIGGVILLTLGLSWDKFTVSIKTPLNIFFLGVCLFSFSIYLLSLFNKSFIVSYLWPLTPIGGLLMIIALVIVIFTLTKQRK